MTAGEAAFFVSKARREMNAAMESLQAVVEGRKAALGERSASTLKTMDALASCYYELDRLDEAEPLYREVLALGRVSLEDSHPVTLNAMNNVCAARPLALGSFHDVPQA